MMRYLEHRLFRILGYAAFFLILFGVFLVTGFPAKRLRGAAESRAASMLDRDVRIGEMDVSLLGNLVLNQVEIEAGNREEDVSLTLAPAASKPDKPKRSVFYLIDEATVDLDLFDLLFDQVDMEVDLDAFGGELYFSYEGSLKKEEVTPLRRRRGRGANVKQKEKLGEDDPVPIELAVDGEGLQLSRMPDLSRILKVPVKGELKVEAELESETGSYRDANGEVGFGLSRVGLSREGHEAATDMGSIKVPPIRIDSIDGIMTIKKGVGTIEKFDVKSKHLDVTAEGTITFADPPSRSQVDMYITFKLHDAYLVKSDSFQLIYSQLETFKSDFRRAKRDDGYYGFRYRGTIGNGRFSPQKRATTGRRESRKRTRGKTRPRRSTTRDRRKIEAKQPMDEIVKPPPIEKPEEPPPEIEAPEPELDRAPVIAPPVKPGPAEVVPARNDEEASAEESEESEEPEEAEVEEVENEEENEVEESEEEAVEAAPSDGEVE